MLRSLGRAVSLLLAICSGACVSEEAACHRRAMASLGCCPSCNPDCEVSKNADAKFALESCLADLDEQREQDAPRHDQSPAAEEDAGATLADSSDDTTFGGTW